LNCLEETAESCELRDNVFGNAEKTFGAACIVFPRWPACLFTTR